MQRIKYLIFLAILLMPISMVAADESLLVSCSPSEVHPGDSVSCVVKGKINDSTSLDSVGSLKFTIDTGSEMSIESFTKTSSWDGGLTGSRVSVYNENQVQNTFDIGTLKIKIGADATDGEKTILFKEIVFNDDIANKTVDVPNKEVQVTVTTQVDTKHYLKSLKPSVSIISPVFSQTQTGYSLVLPATTTSFALTAVPENSDDSVTFINADNNQTLDPTNITFATSGGKAAMMIHIFVGTVSDTPDYSVSVQKDVTNNDNAFELKSLTVGDQTVKLEKGKYTGYVVELYDVSSYAVVADLNDRANYEIKNLVSPRTGAQKFTIVIEPKDSTSGLKGVTYEIEVKKISGGGTTKPTTQKPSNPGTNPATGGVTSVLMALVLMASFGASIYFYKRNMSYFN